MASCFSTFADFWDVLLIDVDFDVFCGDWFFVFTHTVLTVIGEVDVNKFDITGVVIVLLNHIAFSVLSVRQNI